MNCRNFEMIITEMARRQMLEAREKEEVLAHLEDCKHCATRYTDEQALTAGLRVIASGAELTEAPAHIEEALLTAFRQPTTMPSAQPGSIVREERPRWSPWSLAAAATILVVFAFGLLQLLADEMRETARQQVSDVQPAPPSSPAGGAAARQSDIPALPLPASENPRPGSVTNGKLSAAVERRRGLMREAGMKRQLPGNSGPSAKTNEEIATDFLPLTYGNNLSQFDDGQVVRVEVPRSVLQSFGLPINAERAGERVKADVLLGNDGVARAIRFVR